MKALSDVKKELKRLYKILNDNPISHLNDPFIFSAIIQTRAVAQAKIDTINWIYNFERKEI